MFAEIEARYAFIGGTEDEYVAYLHRDVALPLWRWCFSREVKATAGVSAVAKKDNVSLRKLLMQCSANYYFCDVQSRAHLGMCGGSGFGRYFFHGVGASRAACDEDSTFTFVATPPWMHYWCAGPPLRAWQVMSLLPEHMQEEARSNPCCWVSPLYTRLAMGSSHSV